MAKRYLIGHPVATVLLFATLAFWAAIELRQASRRRPEARDMDRASRLVLGLCWTGAITVAMLAHSRFPAAAFPRGAATFGVGLGIVWAGIALRWWSFWTLGRYFTFDVMTSVDQPVISAGPYRLIRHPGYAGLMLMFIGIGVIDANWLSLAALTLLPLVGFVYRIHIEEAALSATLGDAYRAYAARRKRIIPLVW